MTTRLATTEDIPRLVEMGRAFHEASKLPIPFRSDAVESLLGGMIAADHAVIIMTNGAAIGGVMQGAYTAPDWKMAIELFWWSEDGKGLRLLAEFEEWAAVNACSEVRMTSLASLPKADALLRKKGYAATEISYQKVI